MHHPVEVVVEVLGKVLALLQLLKKVVEDFFSSYRGLLSAVYAFPVSGFVAAEEEVLLHQFLRLSEVCHDIWHVVASSGRLRCGEEVHLQVEQMCCGLARVWRWRLGGGSVAPVVSGCWLLELVGPVLGQHRVLLPGVVAVAAAFLASAGLGLLLGCRLRWARSVHSCRPGPSEQVDGFPVAVPCLGVVGVVVVLVVWVGSHASVR